MTDSKVVTFKPPAPLQPHPDYLNFSFAAWPKSVTEIAAEKANDAAVWTPRDVLIDTLRAIDAGEIEPEQLAVVWANQKVCSDSYSGPGDEAKFTMLARVQHAILAEGFTDD